MKNPILLLLILAIQPFTMKAQITEKVDKSENLTIVKGRNGKYGYIDEASQLVIPYKWKNTLDFKEGLAAVSDDNGKYGFIDKTGNLVAQCEWESIGGFYMGLAPVKNENGKWGFINNTGELVVSCEWKDDNLLFWGTGGYGGYGIKDENGEMIKFDMKGNDIIINENEKIRKVIDEYGRIINIIY